MVLLLLLLRLPLPLLAPPAVKFGVTAVTAALTAARAPLSSSWEPTGMWFSRSWCS